MHIQIMLTADTITDDQIRDLLTQVTAHERGSQTWEAAACYCALGMDESDLSPGERAAKQHRARARCAEVANARAADITDEQLRELLDSPEMYVRHAASSALHGGDLTDRALCKNYVNARRVIDVNQDSVGVGNLVQHITSLRSGIVRAMHDCHDGTVDLEVIIDLEVAWWNSRRVRRRPHSAAINDLMAERAALAVRIAQLDALILAHPDGGSST